MAPSSKLLLHPAYLLLAVHHALCWCVLEDCLQCCCFRAPSMNMRDGHLSWLVANQVELRQALCSQRSPEGDRQQQTAHLEGQQTNGPPTRPDADKLAYASNSGEFCVGNLSKRGTYSHRS